MTKINARLIAITQPVIDLQEATPEGVVAYCARVSNPQHQDKPLGSLLNYCIRNKHWSIFEMANAVVEVEAPRDITRQLLRHRSFSFQEFSQRYSDEIEFTPRDARRQDETNRQNSTDDLPKEAKRDAMGDFVAFAERAAYLYKCLREDDVAKECARVILPEGLTMSRLYVNGTLRSWMHYLEVRLDQTTQLEHRVLAEKIKLCLTPVFPQVLNAVDKHDT